MFPSLLPGQYAGEQELKMSPVAACAAREFRVALVIFVCVTHQKTGEA